MKRGLQERQITALERAQRSKETWEQCLLEPPGKIAKEFKLESDKPEDVRAFIEDKIKKAEKCVANVKAKLEAQGVVLKEEK